MTITDINKFVPQKNENFLIDTNIWLYLFCPIGNYKEEQIKPYVNFFDKAIRNGSVFFISSIILSEFINRYLRIEFGILNLQKNNAFPDFKKDFRPSPEYKTVAAIIRSTLKQNILKITKSIDDCFSTLSIAQIVDSIEDIDFNDEYISHLSVHSKLKIVTNDADLKLTKSSPHLITANKRLLTS